MIHSLRCMEWALEDGGIEDEYDSGATVVDVITVEVSTAGAYIGFDDIVEVVEVLNIDVEDSVEVDISGVVVGNVLG